MGRRRWYCLVCKKLSEKARKKGIINKYYIISLFDFNSEKEAIKHLKDRHPKEYKRAVPTGESK